MKLDTHMQQAIDLAARHLECYATDPFQYGLTRAGKGILRTAFHVNGWTSKRSGHLYAPDGALIAHGYDELVFTHATVDLDAAKIRAVNALVKRAVDIHGPDSDLARAVTAQAEREITRLQNNSANGAGEKR